MYKTLLIIPCYNEASRLDVKAFENLPIDLTLLFANDGSTDETLLVLTKLAQANPRIHIYSPGKNYGKANIIYHAFQDFLKNNPTHIFDWIGFWDADLATPLYAYQEMLKYLDFYPNTKIDAIWGSRVARLGSDIQRKAYRHYLARIFVTLSSNILQIKAYDSQCGAKLFSSQAACIAFESPFISKWIFDIEILLRLKNFQVIEFPLLKWIDIPGSKVKIFREMFRVLGDLYKIRKIYLKKSGL